MESQIKSPDAARYWSGVGYTIRYTFGAMISASPKRIASSTWSELPLGIRSRLSREMNRLQHRTNRQVKPLSEDHRVKYRIRQDSAIRRPDGGPGSADSDPKMWNRLYHTESTPTKLKKVRRLIYTAPKQKLIIQD